MKLKRGAFQFWWTREGNPWQLAPQDGAYVNLCVFLLAIVSGRFDVVAIRTLGNCVKELII